MDGDVVKAQVDGHDGSTRVAVEGFFLATAAGVDDAIGVQPQGRNGRLLPLDSNLTAVGLAYAHVGDQVSECRLEPVLLISQRKLSDETR